MPPCVKPVIEYVMSLFQPPFGTNGSPTYAVIADSCQRYLMGSMPYDELDAILSRLVGNTKPGERLRDVLETDARPISPSRRQNMDRLLADPNSRKKCQPWTYEEDTRLLAGILRFGLDNWTTISRFVGNGRTRSQCSQRWSRGLDPKICKLQWTDEEGDYLRKLVEEHGTKAWSHIAAILGNRSDVQCRYHWNRITKREHESVKEEAEPQKEIGIIAQREDLMRIGFGASFDGIDDLVCDASDDWFNKRCMSQNDELI